MSNTTISTTRRTARSIGGVVAVGTLALLSACGSDDAEDAVDSVVDAGEDVEESADTAAEEIEETVDTAEDDVEEAADDAEEAADDAASEAESASGDLAEVLRDNGLESVASAVQLVDFSELTDAPDFTFFAPNDAAFTALSADELADLLASPSEVGDVLRNHTVATKALSSDLSDGMELETEAGNVLTVSIDGDTVMIGEATVVEADVDVNEGVVHVIDGLLLP